MNIPGTGLNKMKSTAKPMTSLGYAVMLVHAHHLANNRKNNR
jgi:hypothetical protein